MKPQTCRGIGAPKALLLMLLFHFLPIGSPLSPAGEGKSRPQQGIRETDWSAVRGVNFIPSYAANTYDIWRHYNPRLFDRELRLARGVGYNSVRLWLNYRAYEELGPKMVDNVEDALRLCAKYNLRAVLNLFDSCGVRPRKDAQWMSASEAYDHFMASSRLTSEEKQFLQHLFGNYAKGFGAHTLVPVGSDSPITALLFQDWESTPGNDRLGPDSYPKLEGYVNALIGRLKNNPSILFWDLMNEPEFASEGPFTPTLLLKPEMVPVIEAFLGHFYHYVKKRHPDQVVSIGWALLDDCEKYARWSDVLTFHVYGQPQAMQQAIERAVALSRKEGKPIVITETLANWDFGSPDFGRLATDEEQLAHYKKVLPVLMNSPIGWMAWGMVISRDFDPFTDIFYPNGHPRPAALYLERMLKGAQGSRRH